jgi:flagellar protein FliO/FliZ
MELWDMVVRMASSLALVVAMMLVLAAAAKRLGGSRLPSPSRGAVVQILGSGYLGPRKAVSLVLVAGELLIVGTTQTDIVPLGRLSDAEQIKRALAGAPTGGSIASEPFWARWWSTPPLGPMETSRTAPSAGTDGAEGHASQ